MAKSDYKIRILEGLQIFIIPLIVSVSLTLNIWFMGHASVLALALAFIMFLILFMGLGIITAYGDE